MPRRLLFVSALAVAVFAFVVPSAFADSVTCILPNAQQITTTTTDCHAQGGVVYTPTPAAAPATASAGTVEQGGACTQTVQCAGNLACLGGVCNINYAACSAPCGSQNGSVAPGGECAYNYDCADQGTTQYSCLNGVCQPDQGTITAGSPCQINADGSNDCAGNLACIAGICQVDTSTLPGSSAAGGGTGAGGTGAGATPGAGGINLSYLQGYETGILSFINGILAPILIAVAFIFFLYSVYKYFIQGAIEPKERETGRNYVIYAVIGFAVIFSLWGLVNVVTSTFNFSPGGTAASHGLTPPTL